MGIIQQINSIGPRLLELSEGIQKPYLSSSYLGSLLTERSDVLKWLWNLSEWQVTESILDWRLGKLQELFFLLEFSTFIGSFDLIGSEITATLLEEHLVHLVSLRYEINGLRDF